MPPEPRGLGGSVGRRTVSRQPVGALVTEVVMTMMFLVVILGATDKRAPQGLAPIAIGLCLTLIHLISIPVTNTSVNPARNHFTHSAAPHR